MASNLNLGLNFEVKNLESILSDLRRVTDKVIFPNPNLKLSKDLILRNLQDAIDYAIKSLQIGELDPAKLGLSKVISNVESLLGGITKHAKGAVSETLTTLRQEIADYKVEIENLVSERDKLEDEKDKFSSYSIKKQAKEETGFTGQAVNAGSLEEAINQLKKLEALQSKDPKVKQQVKFYEKLVDLYKKGAIELKRIKEDEDAINRKIKYRNEQIEKRKPLVKAEDIKLMGQRNQLEQELLQILSRLGVSRNDALTVSKKLREAKKEETKATRENNKTGKEEEKNLGERATAAFSYYLIFNQLKRVFNDTLRVIKQLDKAMTDAAMVTNMSRQEAWKLLGTYQNLAKSTGLATSEIATTVTQFLRQGRSVADALKLTEVAAKSAKVAGISASEAVNYLTSAVNGFGLSADKSEDIADKFAAIASRSASSFEELAIAMSKVSPTAKSAGVSVDFMMGVIAKGIETTREAPENIGTAFKTIFARMREVTDMGKAMEDGMTLNRVEKALKSVGVALRDDVGQFRNLENVLMDVGEKWDTLGSIEQAYLATALAGSRQQPRLLAIFNDFARTKELIEISAAAAGELSVQHIEFMGGSEAAFTSLRTSWEKLTMAFVQTDFIIFAINSLANVLNAFGSIIEFMGPGVTTFILTIGGLSLALTTLAEKIFLSTMNLAAETGVMAFSTAGKKLSKKAIKDQTKEYNKLTGAQKLNAIATGIEASTTAGATATKDALTLSLKKAWTGFAAYLSGIWAIISATFFWIMANIVLIVQILFIVGAVAILAWVIYEAMKNTEFFAEEIQKTNNKLNDLAAKERDLKKVVKRFDELAKNAFKTKEELEELDKLADQLSSYEFEGQTFSLTRRDITGRIVFDQASYNALLKAMNDKRDEFLQANTKSFNEALQRDGLQALDNTVINTYIEKMGQDIALDFIDSFGDTLDAELSNRIRDSIQSAISRIDKSIFFKIKDLRFLQLGTSAKFDEEAYEAFIQKTTTLLINSFQTANERINDLETEGNQKIQDSLEIRIDEYQKAIEEARRQFTGKELTAALNIIYSTMRDEKILDFLVNVRRVPIEVVVEMLDDTSLDNIKKITDNIEEEIMQAQNKAVGTGKSISGTARQGSFNDFVNSVKAESEVIRQDFNKALGLMFSGSTANILDGFKIFSSQIKTLIDFGTMSVEEAEKLINQVANAIVRLSSEQTADLIKTQVENAREVIGLSSSLLKGDFAKFNEVLMAFGSDIAKGVLRGDIQALTDYFKGQKDQTLLQIDESIAVLKGLQDARKKIGKDLTDAEKRELESLQIMRGFYEELVVLQQIRNYRMSEAKDTIKEMNLLLSTQQKLLELGIGGNIIDIFGSMADKFYESALDTLIDQFNDDIKYITDNFVKTVDGEQFFNPDDFGLAEPALVQSVETFAETVDLITSAYQRQKRVIEERYKGEIDAIKKAHTERWTEIDYTNRLVDVEEKLVNARRRLAGLAISGVSRGTLEQAQKDLKKLQEERQKMIEQSVVDKATKQLEIQMNDDLIKAQEQLASRITSLISSIEGLENVFLQQLFSAPDNPAVILGKVMRGLGEDLGSDVDRLLLSNGKLIETNEDLTKTLNKLDRTLRRTMGEDSSDRGAGGGGSTGSIATDSTFSML
jgi:TP901 family phage tail tape measure protein